MKRVILSGLAIAALAAAMAVMPASAQTYRNGTGYRNENGYPDYRNWDNDRGNMVWENSQNLNSRGWQRVTLWVDDPASALFLEVVRGSIEFDRAEIFYEGGQRSIVDMNGVMRNQSRFPIARFGNLRNVDRVVVTARPRTWGARLGIWRDTGSYGWNDRNGRNDQYNYDNDWNRRR